MTVHKHDLTARSEDVCSICRVRDLADRMAAWIGENGPQLHDEYCPAGPFSECDDEPCATAHTLITETLAVARPALVAPVADALDEAFRRENVPPTVTP